MKVFIGVKNVDQIISNPEVYTFNFSKKIHLLMEKYFIFCFWGLFLVSMFSYSYAHESPDHNLKVTTDDNNYDEGDIVAISVKVSEYEGGSIGIQIWKDGDMIDVNQGEVTFSGDTEVTYSYITIIEGPSWTKGNYVVRAAHHGIIGETTFTVWDSAIDKERQENTSEPPKKRISIKMEKSSFYLDSPNKIIRGTVEIQNYIPSDGRYFMKITHIPSEIILKDFEIFPKPSENDLWTIPIAYPILESDLYVGDQKLLGEFDLKISTEFGIQTATTNFSIFESENDENSKNTTNPTPLESEPGQISQTFQNIPQWIKTNAGWWANDKISEPEFLRAIEYLIKNEIMTVSLEEKENLPNFTKSYFLPSQYSKEYVEITGKVSEKHQGALTLTIVKPDNSKENLTTFSRDGNFVTTMELTSESLPGIYQVFAEIYGNQTHVSTFNVKVENSVIVPTWIKNNADWWASGLITDDDFVKGIQYLIEQEILII